LGQVVQRYAEPFRCNDAEPAVEIGHYSVEIDSEDESLVGIHHYSSAGASETCDLICWGHAIIGSVSRTPCKAPWSLLSRSGPRTAVPRYAATTSSGDIRSATRGANIGVVAKCKSIASSRIAAFQTAYTRPRSSFPSSGAWACVAMSRL